MNYYNDNDPKSAERLRQLVSAGLIPAGYVDQRSIHDVRPEDLAGFVQCHFFAGIGGWAEALRLAGIPATTRLWTGSCPCQPFSAAGKRKGTADERHLWPVFRDLIAQCRPPVVFGEQVASADGRNWLSTVRAEMEALAYAVGAADLCAAGVGAPHPRQRLYFVGLADANGGRCEQRDAGQRHVSIPDENGEAGRLADTDSSGRQPWQRNYPAPRHGNPAAATGSHGRLADANDAGPQGRQRVPQCAGQCAAGQSSMGGGLANSIGSQFRREFGGGTDTTGAAQGAAREWERCGSDNSCGSSDDSMADTKRPSPPDSFWSSADWLFCRDGKWRPVEPAAQQMVDGLSAGLGFLRSDQTLKDELTNASKASNLTGQVMLALRNDHAPTEIWWSIGRCIGIPQATLLLAALCEQSRELGDLLYSKAASSSQISETSVRAVQGNSPPAACSPQGRGRAEQLRWELGDALSEMSQTYPSARSYLPLLAEYTGGPLAEKVPGRVGRLRGYGNAIVPQVAATFIRAALMS